MRQLRLDVSMYDDTLQAGYQFYYETNSHNELAVNSNSVNQNAIAPSSTFVFTHINDNGLVDEEIIITPAAHTTAAQLAADINTHQLVRASAFTEVSLTNFSILNNSNTLTIGINITAGVSETMNAFTVTPSFSQMATAINNNINMQAHGVYAIASNINGTIISPIGYDIFVQSHGNATCKMQSFDTSNNAVGEQITLNAGEFVIGTGIVDIEVPKDLRFTCGDDSLFGSINPPATTITGFHEDQISELMTQFQDNLQNNQTLLFNEVVADNNATTNITEEFNPTNAIIQNISTNGTVYFYLVGNTHLAPIPISAHVTPTDLTNLIAAINQNSAITKITAQANGLNNSILLTSVDGYDIQILDFQHSEACTAIAITHNRTIIGDGDGRINDVQSNNAPILALPSFQSMDVLGNAHTKAVTLYTGGARNHLNSSIISSTIVSPWVNCNPLFYRKYTTIYSKIMYLYLPIDRARIIEKLKQYLYLAEPIVVDKLLAHAVTMRDGGVNHPGNLLKVFKYLDQQASVLFIGIMAYVLGNRQLIDAERAAILMSQDPYQRSEKYRLYREEFLPVFNEVVAQKLAPAQFVGFSAHARQIIYERAANLTPAEVQIAEKHNLTKQHFRALLNL
jgi:hypothetical protein